MTPERFEQIEELYHAARDSTAEERAALVADWTALLTLRDCHFATRRASHASVTKVLDSSRT